MKNKVLILFVVLLVMSCEKEEPTADLYSSKTASEKTKFSNAKSSIESIDMKLSVSEETFNLILTSTLEELQYHPNTHLIITSDVTQSKLTITHVLNSLEPSKVKRHVHCTPANLADCNRWAMDKLIKEGCSLSAVHIDMCESCGQVDEYHFYADCPE